MNISGVVYAAHEQGLIDLGMSSLVYHGEMIVTNAFSCTHVTCVPKAIKS